MSGNVDYPCPLAGGRFARLLLPSDLTEADVRRITAFIRALLIEGEEALAGDELAQYDEKGRI